MNNLLETFNKYLSVFDEWEGTERSKNVGSFSFLTKELLVHDIAVSPNLKQGISGIKTFFATEILGIYRNKPKAKISYKEIRSHLMGELSKKPKFNYELLEKCCDYEENKRAFLNESRVMKANHKSKELVEKCNEYMPYVLLDEARKTVWKWLLKFYCVCDEEFCEDCKKRKEIYYKFIQAVAIFEIFFLEYIQAPIRTWQETAKILVDTAESKIKNLCVLKENAYEAVNIVTGNLESAVEAMRMLEKISTEDLDSVVEMMEKIGTFSLLEAEFSVELCAMYQLLLVFESVNVYKDDIDYVFEANKVDVGLKIDMNFYNEYGKNFKTFGRTNEERSVSYRRVNVYLENILSKYANRNYNVVDTVMDFLEELEKKEPTDRFYELMERLAYPIYCKLGGKLKSV